MLIRFPVRYSYAAQDFAVFRFRPQSTKLPLTTRKSALLNPMLLMNKTVILLIKNQWQTFNNTVWKICNQRWLNHVCGMDCCCQNYNNFSLHRAGWCSIISEGSSTNNQRDTGQPDRGFSWVFSVSPSDIGKALYL